MYATTWINLEDMLSERNTVSFHLLEVPMLSIASLCAQCTVRSKNTKKPVWSRERFTAGPCKETSGSCLKNPKVPKSLQQSTFIGKVKERHGLVVAKAEAPILWPPECEELTH